MNQGRRENGCWWKEVRVGCGLLLLEVMACALFRSVDVRGARELGLLLLLLVPEPRLMLEPCLVPVLLLPPGFVSVSVISVSRHGGRGVVVD